MQKFFQPTLFSNYDCDVPTCGGRCVVQEPEPGIKVIWHVAERDPVVMDAILDILFQPRSRDARPTPGS